MSKTTYDDVLYLLKESIRHKLDALDADNYHITELRFFKYSQEDSVLRVNFAYTAKEYGCVFVDNADIDLKNTMRFDILMKFLEKISDDIRAYSDVPLAIVSDIHSIDVSILFPTAKTKIIIEASGDAYFLKMESAENFLGTDFGPVRLVHLEIDEDAIENVRELMQGNYTLVDKIPSTPKP